MQKIQDIHYRVPESKNIESKAKSVNKASPAIVISSLLILVLISFGIYKTILLYKQSKSEDVSIVLAEVRKLVDLPTGENPTIATVTDLKPLGSQEFFKDAHIGDKLLLFTKSKRAILYRPSTNKIIVVAPLNN